MQEQVIKRRSVWVCGCSRYTDVSMNWIVDIRWKADGMEILITPNPFRNLLDLPFIHTTSRHVHGRIDLWHLHNYPSLPASWLFFHHRCFLVCLFLLLLISELLCFKIWLLTVLCNTRLGSGWLEAADDWCVIVPLELLIQLECVKG